MKIMDVIQSWGEPLIDGWAEKLGAKCRFFLIFFPFADGSRKNANLGRRTDERSTGVWDDFHIVDGRIVTGMNPQSAKSTANAAVEAFEKL